MAFFVFDLPLYVSDIGCAAFRLVQLFYFGANEFYIFIGEQFLAFIDNQIFNIFFAL